MSSEATLLAFPEDDSPSASPSASAPTNKTAWLLGEGQQASWPDEAKRFAASLGLASAYGLALGARKGGFSLVQHAVTVPLALLAVGALGVPALYIAMLVFDAPVAPLDVARAASRASAKTGLVLAGLAPVAALYVVSSDSPDVAAMAAMMGLFAASILGLGTFLRDVGALSSQVPAARKTLLGFAITGFAIFATALCLRVWLFGLPLLGGAS